MNTVNLKLSVMFVQDIKNKKYLCLETYRKNNLAVPTPVWFVIHDGKIYVITREETGKIKRLRNNKKIRIALCNFKGKVTGDWFEGEAKFSSTEDSKIAMNLRREKYGIMEKIARFASRNKGDFVVFSIQLN